MMHTHKHSEPESTYRKLIADIEAGEQVTLSRYGYGLLVARLLPAARRPDRSETRMALEMPGFYGDLLSPLD
jgi:antitoxin (DNA-binding transcriptional repressor) of toxin-antitoxin stability system